MGNRIPQSQVYENHHRMNHFYSEQKNHKLHTKSVDKYLQMPKKTINEYLHNLNTFTNERIKNYSPYELKQLYPNEKLNNFPNKIITNKCKSSTINSKYLNDQNKFIYHNKENRTNNHIDQNNVESITESTNLYDQINNFKSKTLNTVNNTKQIKENSSSLSSLSSNSSSLSTMDFTNSSTLSCFPNQENLKSNMKQNIDRDLIEGEQFMKNISINKQKPNEIYDNNGRYLKSPVLNYEQGDTQQISSNESYKQNMISDDPPKKIPQLGLKRRSDGTVTFTAFLRPDSSSFTDEDSLAQLKKRAARYLIGLNRQYKCTVEFYSNPIPYRGSFVYTLKITGPNHSDLIRCRNALPDCIEKCMITPFAHLDFTLHSRK